MSYLKNVKFAMVEVGEKEEIGREKTTGPSYPAKELESSRKS